MYVLEMHRSPVMVLRFVTAVKVVVEAVEAVEATLAHASPYPLVDLLLLEKSQTLPEAESIHTAVVSYLDEVTGRTVGSSWQAPAVLEEE